MGFLSGKRALIVGVAGDRSIAWGIAKAMHREGAEIAYTYQNDKLKERVERLATQTSSDIFIPCDVSRDDQIEAVFSHLDDFWDGLDIIVHSVAFAPRELLEGAYLDVVTREGFRIAHEISSYSFAALAKAGRTMLQNRNGALLTLSYIGAVRALPNYNIMGLAKASLEANVRYLAQSLGPEGIRVNAISAGPIKTLARHDIIVHSVAFAPRELLEGDYLDVVTREGFRIAHEISSYSFAALAKAGRTMLQNRNGALLTLSYIGAVRALPNYNIMGLAKASLEANVRYLAQSLGPEGIRVNAISAGPIKTLAAAGISDFRKMLSYYEKTAPLGRGVTIDEVGNVAAFLCSDLASGITGEITYVDCGFNIVAFSPNSVA